MTPYTLARPPETPGVYILKNIKTSQVYVGSTANLRRRFMAWWSGANAKANIPEHVLRIFKTSPPEDWMFVVLGGSETQDRERLCRFEEATIRRISEKYPDKVLNTLHTYSASTLKLPMSGLPRASGSGAPKTDLRNGDGRRMTYVEAAHILGIRQHTLKVRLRRLRAKGVLQVNINDLL